MIHAFSPIPPRSMTGTPCAWCRLPRNTASSLTVLSATWGSLKWPSMVQFHCPGHAARSLKIQALQDLPIPDSQAKLQSFLGLINYLQPFIPGLSAKTMFICEQLAKWTGTPLQMQLSSASQAWICQTLLSATLAYYDRSKPVVVQTDASKYRLGAALLQSGQPIAFTSKTLTEADLLSKHWMWVSVSVHQSGGVPHLHLWQACQCREWPQTAGNDPAKAHSYSPTQLQHMLLHMQKYDYTIWNKPYKGMVLANCLSCFPSCVHSLPIPTAQKVQHVQLSNIELDII